MTNRERLPERRDNFWFEHSASEVNYGGKTRFQQVAFPPPEDESQSFEFLVYRAVQRFIELLEEHKTKEGLTEVSAHEEMNEIFFDLWSEFPQVRLPSFRAWFEQELKAVGTVYAQLRVNSISQERICGIPRLNYLITLAMVTCIAEIISDYFEKHIDHLGRIATKARYVLGRCLAVQLLQVEHSHELNRQRAEKFGEEKLEEPIRRLLNPFILSFADAADAGLLEEILSGHNGYHVSQNLRNRIVTLMQQTLLRSKTFEVDNIKRNLAEPANWQRILHIARERRHLMKAIRRQAEVRTQIVFENARFQLCQSLRQYLMSSPEAVQIAPLIANDKLIGELLTKTACRKRLLKQLRGKDTQHFRILKQTLQAGVERMAGSQRRFWGSLTRREWLEEIQDLLERLVVFLSQAEDFRLLRSHYGQDSNHGLHWQGIRLWRSYEMLLQEKALSEKDRFVFVNVWERRKIEVQNSYMEGNLFLCQPKGQIYSASSQRQQVIFMFADLRNSTETTMKLTKDTASYLTPYLNAVNSAALSSGGKRIYFAGDGLAAYYQQVHDAVRAAYTLNAQFYKLRKLSNEEHIRRAKEIYQAAEDQGLDLTNPQQIKANLPSLEQRGLKEEVREFLKALTQVQTPITEAVLRQLLSKVTATYSMPRVDVGVALTRGELFLALIGEEQEEKVPIVISPQLTQAARLSGSSEVVRNYIETHIEQPFKFNVYTVDKKLYNRGIVITQDLFHELRQEVEIHYLETQEPEFNNLSLFYYSDADLKRRIIIRECPEPVVLKGIDQPCFIYEVAPPGSLLDKHFGSLT